MTLDAEAAREAIERQSPARSGLDLERAAWAILTIANEPMVTAIREITINQGVDPRESAARRRRRRRRPQRRRTGARAGLLDRAAAEGGRRR